MVCSFAALLMSSSQDTVLCGLCCTLNRAQFSRLDGRCTFLNLTSGNTFFQVFFFQITSHIYISIYVSFMPIMVSCDLSLC